MKQLTPVLATFALLLTASAARADVGDLALVSFAGEVTKVSTGSDVDPDDFWVHATVIVKVRHENGEVTTGEGAIQFKASGTAPKVGALIDGDALTQVVWQTTGGTTVVGKIVDGQWRTPKSGGAIGQGRVIWVETTEI